MNPEQTPRRFFTLLLLLSSLLLAVLMRPLIGALLTAAVLAAVLWPLQKRLARRLGDRRQLAAATLTFATVIAILGPFTGLSAFAIGEARGGVEFVAETLQSEGFEGLLHKLPKPARKSIENLLETVKQRADSKMQQTVAGKLNEQAPRLAAAFGGALAATWSLLFNTVMMLIALFFFLIQGGDLVHWLDRSLPLRPGQLSELLEEFRKTSYAVVVSTVITAAVQGLAALIGYLIARVPHPIFFATLTFFGAFVPVIGAAGFSLLAAFILLTTGHPYAALFLAVWSLTVVALVDNVVKPIVLRGGMDMPGAVVFFALIGGLSAFGPLGLILGPLTVAFFMALLRMYWRDVASGRESEQVP